MSELLWSQYALIGLIFIWSGFVRAGLGFGGAVLSLPFLLLINNDPLLFLPLIGMHLLVFSLIITGPEQLKNWQARRQRHSASEAPAASSIDWAYLKYSLGVMIVPKLVGVLGLLTLPASLMSGIIFCIVMVYATSYILNKPFRSNSKWLDTLFLMLGGYVSGTSLIGAPLIVAVYASHVAKHQLRDTLFVLWFILVVIKMASFVIAGVDLQLIHHLWLLPCAAIGHLIGMRFHARIVAAESPLFYRVVGSVLVVTSVAGLLQNSFS